MLTNLHIWLYVNCIHFIDRVYIKLDTCFEYRSDSRGIAERLLETENLDLQSSFFSVKTNSVITQRIIVPKIPEKYHILQTNMGTVSF